MVSLQSTKQTKKPISFAKIYLKDLLVMKDLKYFLAKN
jgi:hypothetical protein